ncbi:MAG: polyamine ABC transporter substrate-binding protein [Rubrivivax sp.]|jgi:putrescine transport system substrate-binding protein|nr:polyamine ABC transporter substrate-binding protein [Rubrivivax sp.]
MSLRSRYRRTLIALSMAALAPAALAQQAASKELNILNWADYIAPDTIANFEKETGIKVRYDNFDSNETLYARLVAGKTGYDIVVPGAHFAKKLIDGGIMLPLDRAQLPNWKNLDPALLAKVAEADPGNKHLVTWMWGFVTVGINPEKVKAALGSTPMPANPLDLIFDPTYSSKLKSCGVHVLDSASEVVPVAMLYAGKDGFSENAKDYDAARQVLLKARPNITRINSPGPINDYANGQICVSLGYSGDFLIANQRAKEGKTGQTFTALIPPRGATLFFDTMAIPKDAKNVANAHKFIDYIMRPEVHASLTNTVFYGNPNAASKPFVKPEIASNPVVFPSAADIGKMTMPKALSNDIRRVQTRVFTSFKAGK